MAAPESFFEKEVDRTPVGACWVIAIFVTLFFSVSAVGLWKAATYVKRLHVSVDLPTFSFPKNVGEQVKSTAEKTLQEQKQKTTESTKQSIEQHINQEKNVIEQDASQSLKNSLHL